MSKKNIIALGGINKSNLKLLRLINCYFEAISGFTSTGFTIFQEIQELDQTLILWRSSSQWIGGLYFLFSILLLIDLFDENLKRSLTNYISLNSSEIFKQVFKIILIYVSMTILIFILLKFGCIIDPEILSGISNKSLGPNS